jgi:hypothetical protein
LIKRSGTARSTRRSFLKGSAILAAPLAAAVPVAALGDDALKARLARLEDEAAIRALHQAWLRLINTGAADPDSVLLAGSVTLDAAVRRVTPDHNGEPDDFVIAADGNSAVGRFHCAVETVTLIAKDCTFAQMAHLQGGGFVHREERRVLEVDYVKLKNTWAIAKLAFV